MITAPGSEPLQARASALAGDLPPLLARAWRLADAVILGEQGRRRPGAGDAFWQYRPAQAGDPAHAIDWRRSARSDQHFVQQKEWQGAQTVMLWADASAAMDYASPGVESKGARAALLAMALAVLLMRAGERVGLSGLAPGRGQVQLSRLAHALEAGAAQTGAEARPEYGSPEVAAFPAHGRAVFLSDFLGDLDPLARALAALAERGVFGALVMVLDPAEEAFPFSGRTIFESMGATLRHESRRADDLRQRYLERLAARKAALVALAGQSGWQFHVHHSDASPASALLWLYQAMEARR